jgi:hypothetical protein
MNMEKEREKPPRTRI